MGKSKFIILSSARSGSTLLTACVKQHPDLNMHQEIFNIHYKSLDRSIFDFDIECDTKFLDVGVHDSICRLKYCAEAHKKYDGYKVLFWHLKNDVEEYLSKVKLVLLIRRNLFARYVSEIVANQTNTWQSQEEFLDTVYIDPQYAIKNIEYIKSRYRNFLNYNPLIVYYEDDIFDNVDSVCDFLGEERFLPKIWMKKRIRRPLSEVVVNYEEVKHLDYEHSNFS